MDNYQLLQNTTSHFTSANQDYTLTYSSAKLVFHSGNILDNLSVETPLVSQKSMDVLIPLDALRGNSSLEAIVLYLKEILNMKYNEIAKILNRDQRTIWVTYSNSKKKRMILDTKKFASESKMYIPVSIFKSRHFSMLESIVFYLRTNYALSFNQISQLLGKNYRTIWTVYKRALKKIDHAK
jgi:predicted DNA-binding protein (UPF0251 family)